MGVRWLERGEGEPVLLLHGLLGDMEQWATVLEAPSGDSRLIAPTLPLLDSLLEDVSVDGLVAWVVRLMDALGLGRAVVGGHALGGQVALTLALDHPDLVSGLVLTGSSGVFDRNAAGVLHHRPTVTHIRAMMQELVYDPSLVTPEWVERIRRILSCRVLAERVARVAAAARQQDVAHRLDELHAPTLLVWGKQDRVTPRPVADAFHALIPDADLVLVPECGHAPMLERPDLFAGVLHEWLAESRSRRARGLAIGAVR
jgi:pimeloyl-ACP methyl ester carboxylesterase